MHKQQWWMRFSIFTIGLAIMALGVVLIILSNLGASPWDVLHVGLFLQLGLTIGTWSVLAGLLVLCISAAMTRRLPGVGAYLNMLFVGMFIDGYMLLPFLNEPVSLAGKVAFLLLGIVVMGIGIGMYMSASLGAGPRDSLMVALRDITGWSVSRVRSTMEVVVLFFGWLLGGPVFWGTLLFCLTIGPIVGITIPIFERWTGKFLDRRAIRLNRQEWKGSRGANI
ncbi:YczE/YyaS/YitT family protein [Bacillus fonticola]|uniref:YczE/YyaS/YitT family protein n=1 Tax=Bacillus fonticola TaxID=2728853 RepID=UPI001D13A405|nr:YitT family protein [Bacillus fonticola]